MATKLYFHDAANALPGTFPTSRQSTRSVTYLRTATGGLTLRTMDATIGAAMASLVVTTAGTTAFRSDFMGYFCSLPLSGAQTVGGGNFTLNAADAENNLAANFWVNSPTVYVWRPSTGAVVGYLIDSARSAGGSEPDASLTPEVTHIAGIASSAVSAQDGDVIIVEVYSYHNQDSTISRTGTFYFDGTTENTTENAVVSNHASYIEFAETLVFRKTFLVETASELSAAYSPTVAKAVLLATAVETSAAYTTLAVKSALLGTASDTSAAGDLTALKAFLVETASELSAVYSPTVAKAVLLATAVETSIAYTTLAVKSALLGTASDTSSAGDLTALKAFLVETASELSAVYSLTTGKSILLATATELAAAYDIAATKAYLLATATELAAAYDIAATKAVLLDTASELNAAYSFAAFKAVVLEVAQELDAAWNFGGGSSYVSYLGAAQRVYTAVPSVRVLSEF